MSGSKVIFDDTKNPKLTSNLDHSHITNEEKQKAYKANAGDSR